MNLPEGWEVKRLSDIADVFGGGTPDRSNDEFWDDGTIFWATPTDMTAIKNSNYIENTKEKITEKGFSNSSSKILPIGSILLTSRATIGERKITKIPICTNQGFTSLVPKLDNSKFIFYMLDKYISYMYSRAYGTTFPEISRTEVKKISVLLPIQLEEQQKIAKILSTLDKTIESTAKLIDKEKNIKKGLMHDLLTNGIDKNNKIRTPQTHKYKQSELGLIPEEWEVATLNRIASKISDGIHTTPIYSDNSNFYFINGNNLENGRIIITDKTNCVDEEEYNKQKIELTENTILLSINGTIGNLAFYKNEKVVLGKSAAYIIIKDIVNKDFLAFLLSSHNVRQSFELSLTGSTIKNLSIKAIKETKIQFPAMNEQKQIAKILTTQDKKIEKEEASLAKLKELKKGLMNDLLSGKVRVKI